MRRLAKTRPRREPTIALINIVFLMLVFFMVAGTLAQPLDETFNLVNTHDLEGRAPPDALVIHADGTLNYHGARLLDTTAYVAGLSEEDRATLRIVPDRNLPAQTLMQIGRDLRNAGAGRIMIVTERGLE